MTKFKEHGVVIYLSPELYTGFIKLQADKGLGRSYAGLLPFVEGLYHMGYISKEVYEVHAKRYSQPLVSTEPKVLTPKQRKQLKLKEKWETNFSSAIKNWTELSEKSKIFYIKKADQRFST